MKKIAFPLILLLVGLVFSAKSCKKEPTFSTEYMPVVEAVYASGEIEPSEEYKIYATGDGIIAAKNIKEGDNIAKGQLLFKVTSDLETEIREAKVNNAEELYQISKRNYSDNSAAFAEIEAAMTTAKLKIRNDSLNYFRYKQLFEKEAATKSELEKAENAYLLSQNELATQYKRYERLKNELYTSVKSAEGQIKINKADNRNFDIKSESAGKVLQVNKEKGEGVRKNEIVAVIGNASHWKIKLNIDEQDLMKIKIGQEVVVKLDLYKDKVFHAVVSKIYPLLNREQQGIQVDAEFTEESLPEMIAYASVEGNIILNRKENALVVAKSLLLGEDSLRIQVGEKSKTVAIKKGLSDIDYVEVLSGIDEKTIILQPK